MPFIEGRPDLSRPRNEPWLSREGGGEYDVIMALLEQGLPDITAQHKVGRFLIDAACWPVAYEVWTTSTRPHKVKGQLRKIIALIEQGWTVCYLHTHRDPAGWLDPQIFPALAGLWRCAGQGEAPQYVYVHRRVFASVGLVDGELVMSPWTEGQWARIESDQGQAEWERKDLKRRDALRRRYWLNKYGVEPPPRGQRRRRP